MGVVRLGPQPLVALQQSPNAISWRAKPTTYVVCTDDMIVHPDLQRLMAKRCANDSHRIGERPLAVPVPARPRRRLVGTAGWLGRSG